MQKSTKITLIIIAAALIVAGGLWFILGRTKFVTDHDYLYDAAVRYLLDSDSDPYRDDLTDYQRFADYQGFGITEDSKYYYVYIWIFDEAYYVDDNDHLRSYTGGSMPYKFHVDRQTDEILGYEVPFDGSDYAASIYSMFPTSVARKVLATSSIDDSKIKSEVQAHYDYLEDTTIYYSDGKN